MRKELFFLLFSFFLFGAFFGGAYFFIKFSLAKEKKNFVSCLKNKGITLYLKKGEHFSEKQLEILKDFENFPMVFCEKNFCFKKGIYKVPTWFFPKGSLLKENVISCGKCTQLSPTAKCETFCFEKNDQGDYLIAGVLSLKELEEITNCKLRFYGKD